MSLPAIVAKLHAQNHPQRDSLKTAVLGQRCHRQCVKLYGTPRIASAVVRLRVHVAALACWQNEVIRVACVVFDVYVGTDFCLAGAVVNLWKSRMSSSNDVYAIRVGVARDSSAV